MTPQATKDLVERISTVLTPLGGVCAATLGGTENDPALENCPLPSAWVRFEGSQSAGPNEQRSQAMLLNFSAVLVVEYGKGETDFTDTQLKLIDDVSQAVRGTQADPAGNLWTFLGANLLTINPDRCMYLLQFQVRGYYAKQLT